MAVDQVGYEQQQARLQFLTKELFTGEEAEEVGVKLASMLKKKHAHYTDSILRVALALEVFYPNGVKPGQFVDFALVVRTLDKIMRISSGKRSIDNESPWIDVAGYGVLGQVADNIAGTTGVPDYDSEQS